MFLLLKHQKVQTKQSTESAQVTSTGRRGRKTLVRVNSHHLLLIMFVCFFCLSFYSLIPNCDVGVDLIKNYLCTGAGLYFSVSTEMIIGGSGSFQSVTCHPDTLPDSLSAFQPFQIRLILKKHHLLRIEVLGASFLRDLTEAILFLLLTGGFLCLFTCFFCPF